MIEEVVTCPLKSECTSIKDNKIHRCAWFQTLAGTNPNTGEQVDEKGCAIAWMPMLMIENSMQQRSTSAAVESFRNETVQANQKTQQILMLSQTNKMRLINDE